MSTPLKHNKKRNVGLITEFLSRHIASLVLDTQQKPSKAKEQEIEKIESLWIRTFAKGTEMAKEQALFNALYTTQGIKSREMASSLLEEVKRQCRLQNEAKLTKEKTAFLQEVKNKTSKGTTEDFFAGDIEDYRTRATIQILLNTWRENDIVRISETIHLEEQVIEHLLSETKQKSVDANEVLSMGTGDIDGLVGKLMTEKFEKKYSSILSEDQKKIVSQYITISSSSDSAKRNSIRNSGLIDTLSELRISTLAYIDVMSDSTQDKALSGKLIKIRELMEGKYRVSNAPGVVNPPITDDTISFYMTVSQLKEELKSS